MGEEDEEEEGRTSHTLVLGGARVISRIFMDSIDWLGWLADWLVDWLLGWLSGWLAKRRMRLMSSGDG